MGGRGGQGLLCLNLCCSLCSSLSFKNAQRSSLSLYHTSVDARFIHITEYFPQWIHETEVDRVSVIRMLQIIQTRSGVVPWRGCETGG